MTMENGFVENIPENFTVMRAWDGGMKCFCVEREQKINKLKRSKHQSDIATKKCFTDTQTDNVLGIFCGRKTNRCH